MELLSLANADKRLKSNINIKIKPISTTKSAEQLKREK